MEVLAAIAGILKAWPETIKFINRVADGFEQIKKIAKEKELQDFLQDLDSTLGQVDKAQSLRERIDAAKKLSDLVRRLG